MWGSRPVCCHPDLPVMRATKFKTMINLQSARTLGLTVPPGLE
jgi:hypothetical protein